MSFYFKNNARGMLRQELPEDSTLMVMAGADDWEGEDLNPYIFSTNPLGTVMRLTITNPSELPGAYEIVETTSVADGRYVPIRRGMEDTVPRAWPAGSNVEARITAGVLGSFVQSVPGPRQGQSALPTPFTAGMSADTHEPMFGVPAIICSYAAPLGAVEEWVSHRGVSPGQAVYHPDFPNVYLTALEHWYAGEMPTDTSALEYVASGDIISFESEASGSVPFYVTMPGESISIYFGGHRLLVTEVGFVVQENEDPETNTAHVLVEVGDFSAEVEIRGDLDDVIRLQIPSTGTTQRLVERVYTTVLQRASDGLSGYFYAVGLPLPSRLDA